MEEKNNLADNIFSEIRSIMPSKSCCQKAHLCGLLYNCRKNLDTKGYTAFFRREQDAIRAAEIINTRFSGGVVAYPTPASRGGHRGFDVPFYSKALSAVFADIDNKRTRNAREAIGFRCDECEANFMRGVFLSCVSTSQPKNGYRLEFSIENNERADAIAALLDESVAAAGRTQRGNKTVLYYRSNVKISDLLYTVGALHTGFEVTDMSIERAIRNNENRATNCVAHNISRSVDATRKQIDAIKFIIEKEKTALLDEELQMTARLRIENDSASLAELAALHEPPITKSGVNGRLKKILVIAEELKKA